ncbi:hypothetical protein IQ235_03435 [Oscillatoriales cyanobacterium LEGE 11467]|uniref:histidine kinase n=1 Tax=Zarconia navalis LEGE 11467 TaxID=1828826 RepID=A0A928VT13_9CYAN|nr:histidine kinase dimerization/phospho-acceptor domain-containing protein [Zarconia navalis]MBE9039844.1 hypothetical protein [Zarconia navalis LEGE 11467]
MTNSDRIDPQSINSHTSTDSQISDIAHEFRTALNTILMSVELLTEQELFGTQIDRKYYLQHIRGAVENMNELLIQSESKAQHQTSSIPWTSFVDNSYRVGSRLVSSERPESSRT